MRDTILLWIIGGLACLLVCITGALALAGESIPASIAGALGATVGALLAMVQPPRKEPPQ
jgi:hypothetical protein